ncbi:MAG: hypothetical protein HC847_01530 [Hydrococcus sp. RU_2_2]|nr:hypothetical protein [Hydrococcus sp. RU_2_2]
MQHMTGLKQLKQLIFGLVGLGVGGSFLPGVAVALDQETMLLLTEPLDFEEINRLWAGEIPADGSIVTENSVSQAGFQDGLTAPSLWWADDQFGGKLLDYWVAHSGGDGSLRRVDLLINQQVWSQYNYLQRYSFVHHLGTSARDFGYNTRVFNWQGNLLGAYICEPEIADTTCRVFLDPTNPGAASGTTPVGGSQSITGGTDR